MVAAGSQLGPYRIEALAWSGGNGSDYRAVDTRLDRKVAIVTVLLNFFDELRRRVPVGKPERP